MIVAIDHETYSRGDQIDVIRDKVVLTSVVFSDGREYLFEFGRYPDWLPELLQDSKVLKLMHNVAFDALFFQRDLGVNTENCWDTLATERLLTSGLEYDCSLNAVTVRRLGKSLNKGIRDRFSDPRYKSGILSFSPEMREYCMEDSRVLLPIYQQQQEEIKAKAQTVAANLENFMGIIVKDMRLRGIGFDKDLWYQYLDVIRGRKAAAEEAVWQALGIAYSHDVFGGVQGGITLTSRDRVLKVLRRNGIKLEDYRATTILYYLHKNIETQPECVVLRDILAFKKWAKAATWSWVDNVHPVTGRIHPNFNPQGTRTLRFSSQGPNLQQVTKPYEGVNFRHLFTAAPGYVMVGADYSQIEFRILAETTQEQRYVDAFLQGVDMHTLTAEAVLGRPLVDEKERNLGKAVNFGVTSFAGSYLALQGSALSYGMLIPKSTAQEYVAKIRQANRKVEAWGRKMLGLMKLQGYLETPCGHRRYLLHEDRETVARNTPIQMFAAGILKDSMVRIYKRFKKEGLDATIVLQVHDELVVECKESIAEYVRAVMVEEMEAAGRYWLKTIPVEVTSYISRTWEK